MHRNNSNALSYKEILQTIPNSFHRIFFITALDKTKEKLIDQLINVIKEKAKVNNINLSTFELVLMKEDLQKNSFLNIDEQFVLMETVKCILGPLDCACSPIATIRKAIGFGVKSPHLEKLMSKFKDEEVSLSLPASTDNIEFAQGN